MKYLTIILIILAGMGSDSILLASETGTVIAKKSFTITWEAIDGAIEYEVWIDDAAGNRILKSRTAVNSITFSAVPGAYRIKIGALNKFGKFGSWSDWEEFRIVQGAAPGARKFQNGIWGIGIKLGAGATLIQIINSWKDVYKKNSMGYAANLGYRLGGVPVLNTMKFFQYTGIETEANFYSLDMAPDPSRTGSSVALMLYGGGIYFSTNFSFPLNLLLRFGGGMAITEQRSYPIGQSDSRNTVSRDPYYRTGIALEYKFLQYWYVETGVDYYTISYLGRSLDSMRFFGMAGLRL